MTRLHIQPLSERVLVREIFLGERLVDYHDRRRILAIMPVEGTALFNGMRMVRK